MIKKLALGFLMVGLTTAMSFAGNHAPGSEGGTIENGKHHKNKHGKGVTAAVDSAPASDNASNSPYQPGNVWSSGSNGGSGFGGWSFNNTGSGGEYIGGTGETETPSFGVFSADDTDFGSASRPFTGALGAGQTFSVDIGTTAIDTGGNVGLNLLAGGTPEFTLKAVGGGTTWELNDGGTDFGIAFPLNINTKVHFAYTYDGGSNYQVSLTDGTNTFNSGVFMSTNPISGLDGVQFFSAQQGSNNNFGANNLAIVPEPATILLVGPTMLAGLFYIRRRRS